jgi:2-amino-4-hydroxy-6-hydroxymethyldihydropteridine diphosphokinase
MSTKIYTVTLALGSNIGDRKAALKAAIQGLAPYANVIKQSPIYETAAAYVTDQPPFLNMVVLAETKLEPLPLLQALKRLETELGRAPTFRYGPRLLDIDIVFYGDEILTLPELTLPHPRLAEREFVLRPLADITPDWKHPSNGQTVAEMLARVVSASPVCLGPL